MGDPHQRSRRTHLPGCQISHQQIGRKLKNPKSDLILALGMPRGLKGSYIDIYAWHKTTTEISVFHWFCHLFNGNMPSEYEGMRPYC